MVFLLLLSLSGSVPSAAAADKPKPTATPTATPAAQKPQGTSKRVFTNDDLEAGRDKPSAVQDLSATGVAPAPDEPMDAEPARDEPAPEDPGADQARRIKEAEEQVKALDDQANQLLWLYLGSTDTNEILRLKAEQQEVLDRLKAAKADLARLKGEAGSDGPAPTPTPPPG
ncbi:MAG TPA: hypothetical protein VFQ51_10265 [Vicinamibacteria bacterium]|nr:hypothetical protein [Vicinamibacteria bacterium]